VNSEGRNKSENPRGQLHRCEVLIASGGRGQVPCHALVWTSERDSHAAMHRCAASACGFAVVPTPPERGDWG
jgi:hypothetical protein